MTKKKKKTPYKEKTLAIEEAENLTVAQVSAKSDEIEIENLTKESSLDKYIRQHRSDIESVKKERQLKAAAASDALDKLVKTAREETKAEPEKNEAGEVDAPEVAAPLEQVEAVDDTPIKAVDEAPLQTSEPDPDFPEIQGGFDAVDLVAEDTETPAPDQAEKAEGPVAPIQEEDTSEVAEQPDLVDGDETKISPEPAKTPLEVPEMPSVVPPKQQALVRSTISDEETRDYKKPIIIGICALLLISAGGLVWHNANQANQNQAAKTAASKAKKSKEAKEVAPFNTRYAKFFVDTKQTKLKNDQFGNLADLTSELAKLKDHADYKALKAKVTELKAEISAIQAMNANFDKAVIMDGVLDKTAKVKDDAKLSYTATENTALNTLLKAAVTLGQDQQKAKATPAPATPSAPPATPATPAGGTGGEQPSVPSGQPATTTPASGAAASGYGLTTAQYQTQYPNVAIETGKSRVPVDPNADLTNPAFEWAPGIRDLVLGKCRERGYITGDAYILLPASIQKGNGYYNLYRPDGTYLVSINCKTGYFVGNGAGHADDLDY
jgi:hypothetical protein